MKPRLLVSTLSALLALLCYTACDPPEDLVIEHVRGEATDKRGGGFTDFRNLRKYRTVKIGDQTWMAENLSVKTGTSWCYGGEKSNCKGSGRLYDWETAVRACPRGWHLPSHEEWSALLAAADGVRDTSCHRCYSAGKKLKSKTGWVGSSYFDRAESTKNYNGTDDFGFSALPGGGGGAHYTNGKGRYTDGPRYNYHNTGLWWSATDCAGADAHAYYLSMHSEAGGKCLNESSLGFSISTSSGNDYVYECLGEKEKGFSVRCVQD